MITVSVARRAALASLTAAAGIVIAMVAALRPAHAELVRVATPPFPFHLRLEKSEPAKDETLATAPKVIRLWFSLPPEMAVTAVKLADANGASVALAAPTRGSGAKDPVQSVIQGALADGSYSVSWKTSSKDGHPIRGDFSFTVKGSAR
ncbi:MAG: copper resistance protein CopC [Gemmatimonadaceae bacterium]|nr:copper resistance protein CopC [Gemmatimonadaceae bacterium]